MPSIINGHFLTRKKGHNKTRCYFKRTYKKLERFKISGFDSKDFINSVFAEQNLFEKKEDEERTKVLITYVICRIKEVLKTPEESVHE